MGEVGGGGVRKWLQLASHTGRHMATKDTQEATLAKHVGSVKTPGSLINPKKAQRLWCTWNRSARKTMLAATVTGTVVHKMIHLHYLKCMQVNCFAVSINL